MVKASPFEFDAVADRVPTSGMSIYSSVTSDGFAIDLVLLVTL